MVGMPNCGLSPPSISTSPNSTILPGSAFTRSIRITSSAATRYCLPPALMTANIVLPLCSTPVLGLFRTGFFQSVFRVFLGLDWPLKKHADHLVRDGHAYGGERCGLSRKGAVSGRGR